MSRLLGILVLGAVLAYPYPVVLAWVAVALFYNHPVSAKLLYGYYFKSTSRKLPGSFFHFTSKFIHDGDEEMVFDTVVACNTRISGNRATGSSVLNGIGYNSYICGRD